MLKQRLHGLVVAVPSAIPGVLGADEAAAVDLELRFAPAPSAAFGAERFRSPASDAAPALIARERADGSLHLAYSEGAEFTIAADGRTAWCEWHAPLTIDDVFTFVTGPVLGIALRAHGALPLHASAIVHGEGAWLLLGQGGVGKSTLAAACARAGLPVLGEDLIAVREGGEGWIASPGSHLIRLWEGGNALVAGDLALPPISAAWPKRGLSLAEHHLPVATRDLPVRGVLVLSRGEPGHPVTQRLSPAEAAVELVAHAYANQLVGGDVLARELLAFGRLATAVPHWRFAIGDGAKGLRESVTRLTRLASGV